MFLSAKLVVKRIEPIYCTRRSSRSDEYKFFKDTTQERKKGAIRWDIGMTSESCRFTEKCTTDCELYPTPTLENQYPNTDLVNDAEKILMSCNVSVLHVQIGVNINHRN